MIYIFLFWLCDGGAYYVESEMLVVWNDNDKKANKGKEANIDSG